MSGRRAVWRVVLIVTVAQLGFAAVIPLLPLHLTERLGASVKLVGLVVATFALVETLFKTAWGGMADKIGRKPIMVAGLVLSATAPAVMAVLRAPALFVPLRLLDGMGSAALWPAAAVVVADTTAPDRRATGMGMLNVALLGGIAAGPSLGLFVAGFAGDIRAGFYLASGLLALAALLAAALLPDEGRGGTFGGTGGPPGGTGGNPEGFGGNPGGSAGNPDGAGGNHGGAGDNHGGAGDNPGVRPHGMRISAAGLRVPPALLGLYLMAFVQMFGAGMLVPIAVIYAKQVVGLEEKAIGTLFLVIVAAVALTTIPAGRMADRVGKRWVVMAGMVLAAAGMWLVPATSRLEGLLAAGVLLGLSYALTFPAWLALVTEMAPPARLGLAVGASETAQGLGLVVGPLLGGFLWDAAGPHAPFVASAAAMTAGAVIAAMVLWRLQWKR